MKIYAFILYLSVTLLFSKCTINDWDINRFTKKFEKHKNEFENLVVLLKSENIRIGYTVNENELSSEVQKILEKLDINDVLIKFTDCKELEEYQFTCLWSKKATLYFTKDECNKEQTIKGYHSTPSEMIEIWGLDDGWIMWIDHDFI